MTQISKWSHNYDSLSTDPAEFRLVTISPGVRPNYIVASLTTHLLTSHPPYEALSYVWGPYDLEDPCLIELDGVSFQTTINLWRALYYLRSENEPRNLWIDAICINQEDLHERSSQVQLMRYIYQNSSCTVVWLGEESFWSGRLFEFLKGVEDTRRWDDDNDRIMKVESQQRLLIQLTRNFDVLKLVQKGLYEDIAQRDFWTRIWIVQEVVLSSKVTVCCGPDEMTWETFSGSIWNLDQAATLGMPSSQLDAGGLPNLETLNTLREINKLGGQLLLSDVLACLRRARATDARDMIYGLLGILPVKSIRPDYGSMTARKLYTDLVNYCITEENSLDIITLCHQPTSRLDLPSWVPDWTESWSQQVDEEDASLTANPLVLKYGSGELLRSFTKVEDDTFVQNAEGVVLTRSAWSAHASRPPKAKVEILESLPSLVAEGIFIGEIFSVGDTLTRSETDGELFFCEAFLNWEEVLRGSFGSDINDSQGNSIQDVFDRYFDILDAYLTKASIEFESERLEKIRRRMEKRAEFQYKHDQSSIKYHGGDEPFIEALVRTILADLDQDYQRLSPETYRRFWDTDLKASTALGFEIWALSFATNRSLIITENGYIGLGSRPVRPNDQVCIIYGCSVPLVVRPCDSGFSIIGEAYVHGLMDGEALECLREKKFKEMNYLIF